MFSITCRLRASQTYSLSALFLALIFCASSCSPASESLASEVEPAEEPEPVAVTVFTDTVQLFMEYPRLFPGVEARFLAHVTVLETGAPIRTGELRLELTSGGGAMRTIEALQPTRDGLFIPEGTFDRPGQFQARILVESEQAQATIELAPIVVHQNLAEAFAAAEAEASEEPADAVPFLLEQQWKIGLLMEMAERRSLTKRLQVFGEVEAPHYAMAVVSAPMTGLLHSAEPSRLPHLGDRVEKGQVLAIIVPPLSTSDVLQMAANGSAQESLEMELLVREFELRSKSAEIELEGKQAEARLEFARSTLVRAENLREKDLGTVAELEAARLEVELAERAVAASMSLQSTLSESLNTLENLQSRRETSHTQPGPEHQALVAPISGEIVEADKVEGELIESHAAVYRVLDLSRVWIAAHVSEFDLGELGDTPGALLRLAAFPDREFDVLGEMEGHVVQIGRIVDPETRTVILHYEAENPGGLFRTGMLADVYLETRRSIDAVAIPESAIVMDNGGPVAFVLVHGELFQKRSLKLGIHDGPLIEVLSGIAEGERVVTEGAYLVKLASASPASFGEGHAH